MNVDMTVRFFIILFIFFCFQSTRSLRTHSVQDMKGHAQLPVKTKTQLLWIGGLLKAALRFFCTGLTSAGVLKLTRNTESLFRRTESSFYTLEQHASCTVMAGASVLPYPGLETLTVHPCWVCV